MDFIIQYVSLHTQCLCQAGYEFGAFATIEQIHYTKEIHI